MRTNEIIDDSLVGVTTRPVTFHINRRDEPTLVQTAPAGTRVRVSEPMAGREGLVMIRIPGTLWMQHVTLGSVEPESA